MHVNANNNPHNQAVSLDLFKLYESICTADKKIAAPIGHLDVPSMADKTMRCTCVRRNFCVPHQRVHIPIEAPCSTSLFAGCLTSISIVLNPYYITIYHQQIRQIFVQDFPNPTTVNVSRCRFTQAAWSKVCPSSDTLQRSWQDIYPAWQTIYKWLIHG